MLRRARAVAAKIGCHRDPGTTPFSNPSEWGSGGSASGQHSRVHLRSLPCGGCTGSCSVQKKNHLGTRPRGAHVKRLVGSTAIALLALTGCTGGSKDAIAPSSSPSASSTVSSGCLLY